MRQKTVFGPNSSLICKPNAREKAMYAYIFLIVKKSLPISYFEDPEIRSFCSHNEQFSRNNLQESAVQSGAASGEGNWK